MFVVWENVAAMTKVDQIIKMSGDIGAVILISTVWIDSMYVEKLVVAAININLYTI